MPQSHATTRSLPLSANLATLVVAGLLSQGCTSVVTVPDGGVIRTSNSAAYKELAVSTAGDPIAGCNTLVPRALASGNFRDEVVDYPKHVYERRGDGSALCVGGADSSLGRECYGEATAVRRLGLQACACVSQMGSVVPASREQVLAASVDVLLDLSTNLAQPVDVRSGAQARLLAELEHLDGASTLTMPPEKIGCRIGTSDREYSVRSPMSPVVAKAIDKWRADAAQKAEDRSWSAANAKDCRTPKRSSDCDGVRSYIALYPAGRYAGPAKEQLLGSKGRLAALADNERWTAAGPDRCRKVKTPSACADVESYLNQLPGGKHASEARSLVALICPEPLHAKGDRVWYQGTYVDYDAGSAAISCPDGANYGREGRFVGNKVVAAQCEIHPTVSAPDELLAKYRVELERDKNNPPLPSNARTYVYALDRIVARFPKVFACPWGVKPRRIRFDETKNEFHFSCEKYFSAKELCPEPGMNLAGYGDTCVSASTCPSGTKELTHKGKKGGCLFCPSGEFDAKETAFASSSSISVQMGMGFYAPQTWTFLCKARKQDRCRTVPSWLKE